MARVRKKRPRKRAELIAYLHFCRPLIFFVLTIGSFRLANGS